MALIHPPSALLSTLILLLSLPLLPLALLTSSLAFSALLLRVFLVYIELFLSILRTYFPFTSTGPLHSSSSTTTAATTPTKKPPYSHGVSKSRSFSSLAALSTGTQTPATGVVDRDFEGVGGWRFPSAASVGSRLSVGSRTSRSIGAYEVDDEEDDALWTGINSRLELPAVGAAIACVRGPEGQRRQRRKGSERREKSEKSEDEGRRKRRKSSGGSSGSSVGTVKGR
ncbi:hypothetical protein MMC20_001655 [Loxospora ochrophaea]|nr:hypothetical protein [Loxospora ochrophaea]